MKKNIVSYLFLACLSFAAIFLLLASISSFIEYGKPKSNIKPNVSAPTSVITDKIEYRQNTGVSYIIVSDLEELSSYISSSGGEYTPVILVGANGNWLVDGVDTGIKSKNVNQSFANNGLYVVFVEKVNEDGLDDVYNVIYNNKEIKEFKLNKETGKIESDDLDIALSEDGKWIIDGIETQLKINTSSYDDFVEENEYKKTKEEWLNDLINNIDELYLPTYSCIFYPNNSDFPFTIDMVQGSYLVKPTDPIKEGWDFSYWKTIDNKIYDFSREKIYSELELYAVYTEKDYKILLDAKSNEWDNEYLIIRNSKIDSYKLPIPEKTGCEFLGWYNNDKKVNELSGINSDTILVAKWLPIYTLNILANSYADLCNKSLTIKDLHTPDDWYCDDILVLPPPAQGNVEVMTSNDEVSRASSEQPVINELFKLDIVWETKSKLTAKSLELDNGIDPRFYLRT